MNHHMTLLKTDGITDRWHRQTFMSWCLPPLCHDGSQWVALTQEGDVDKPKQSDYKLISYLLLGLALVYHKPP